MVLERTHSFFGEPCERRVLLRPLYGRLIRTASVLYTYTRWRQMRASFKYTHLMANACGGAHIGYVYAPCCRLTFRQPSRSASVRLQYLIPQTFTSAGGYFSRSHPRKRIISLSSKDAGYRAQQRCIIRVVAASLRTFYNIVIIYRRFRFGLWAKRKWFYNRGKNEK